MTGSKRLDKEMLILRSFFFVFIHLCGLVSGQEFNTFLLPEPVTPNNGTRLLWAGSDNLYTGQSSVYILLLEEHTAITFPDSIEIKTPEDSVFDEVYGIGSIREKARGETVVYDIPIASFILTPGREGDLIIPEARVYIEEQEYVAKAIRVGVVSLKRKAHGIGQIVFSHGVNKTQLAPGEVAIITVQFQGVGNIPFISFEGPRSETSIITVVDDQYEPEVSFLGYTGTRTLRYEVSVGSEEEHRVQIPEFIVYDTATNEYFQQSGAEVLLRMSQQLPTAENGIQGNEFPVERMHTRILHESVYRSETILLIVFIPACIGGIGVCIRLIWKYYG